MKSAVQCGDALEFTAPAGGVISGLAYLINSIVVVAEFSAAAGEKFIGNITGVFDLAKAASVAWTEGQTLYWDSAANNFATAQSATARRAGCAAAAAGAADLIGRVRLNGVPAPANVA